MQAGASLSPATSREAAASPLELRMARGLLVAVALALPFELPLLGVGPLELTTVEVALYAMLAAWGVVLASGVVRGHIHPRSVLAALRTDALGGAVVLWSVLLFASAWHASSYRGAAIKFALRSLSGILAFFAVRTLARPPEVRRRVLWALVAGALVSAATAVLDSWAPATASVWSAFREGAFDTFGLARASGVFAYPTIGAMYWEAAVPLLVVAPFLEDRACSPIVAKRGPGLAVLGGALLVEALLASATRSGLAGAAVAGAALLALVWRSGTGVRRAAVGVLGVLAVLSSLTLAATGSGSLLGQRLHWWRDAHWFGVEYVADPTPRTIHAREPFTATVTLRNTGAIVWRHDGDRPTYLAYHWLPVGRPITQDDFEGRRTELATDVPPGAAIEVHAQARGPAVAGGYRLQWDVVQENVTWFSERGNPMAEQRFDVTASEGEHAAVPTDLSPPVFDTPAPSRLALWHAAIALWREHPLLGIGPDTFRRRYEAVLSPAPNGRPYTDTRIHANSLYLETLADMGLLGLASLALLMWALWLVVRRHYAAGRLAGLGSGMAAGAFFVHGALDYFFEFTPLFGLFWILLGLTAAREPEAPSS